MKITSSAFTNGNEIPPQYTCDGININPPFEISDVPREAKSLALVMDDPDSIAGTWVHWLIWNIPPETAAIPENFKGAGVEGLTSFGKIGYGGPCPQSGVHRYYFRLFALNLSLTLPAGSGRLELEQLLATHTIDRAELMGTFAREVIP